MSIRIVVSVVVLLMLVACGGSGSSGGPLPTAWQGSITSSGLSVTDGAYAIVADDDNMLFYENDGTIYVPLTASDQGTLGPSMSAYENGVLAFGLGAASQPFDLTGSVSSTDITGSFTGELSGTPFTGSFQFTPSDTLTGKASIESGNWQGAYLPYNTAIALTVAADGAFTGNDAAGCVLSGKLTPVPDKNLFKVTLTSTGSGCAGYMLGLAYEDNVHALLNGSAGTYYQMILYNNLHAAAVVLKV